MTTEVVRPKLSLAALAADLNLRKNVILAATLALMDTRLRYRRTTLGPFWVTLSTGLTVLSVGFIFGQIFDAPSGKGQPGYMPYVTTGFVIWSFISASILEGCTVFVSSAPLIKALHVPIVIHVMRMLARNVILLAHNAILIVLLWIFLQWHVGWETVLVIPGLVLMAAGVVGVVLTLSVLCTRYRDIPPIVQAFMQLMFLITPILWPSSNLKGGWANLILELNPVYNLMEVVRGPLLGTIVPLSVWISAFVTASVSLVLGLWFFRAYQHRLPYWV